MKIKALKKGRFAHPQVHLPQLTLIVGKEYDVDEEMARELLRTGWGEVAVEAKDKSVSKMNKGELIQFAKDNEIELDETMTNVAMVFEIETVLDERKNG